MDLTKSELVKPSTGQGIVLFMRRLFARQEAAILIPLIVLTLFFYLRNPAMLAPLTITSILRTMAFPGLIGMGMVLLMIAGEIDLSTAPVMSLTAVFAVGRDPDWWVPTRCSVVVRLGGSLLV